MQILYNIVIFRYRGGISNEEKIHIRNKLLLHIREENTKVRYADSFVGCILSWRVTINKKNKI